MMIAACVLITAALFFYIFSLPRSVEAAEEKTRLTFLRERKEVVYENLRDLNFELRAGKLPEADYRAMSASMEEEAAVLLAEIEMLERQSPLPQGAKV